MDSSIFSAPAFIGFFIGAFGALLVFAHLPESFQNPGVMYLLTLAMCLVCIGIGAAVHWIFWGRV